MLAGQKSVRGGIEDYLCPFTDLYMTCAPNEGQYHKGTMAMDVRGAEPGVRYPVYAPATSVCIWAIPSNGQAMWQTVEPVRTSDGSITYVTYVTCHDDVDFNAHEGMIIPQGGKIANMGRAGNTTGVHTHYEGAKGKLGKDDWHQNQYGNWCFANETDPENLWFMNNTNILNGIGNWKYIPAESHKIGYKAHVQSDGWQDWKFDGETAGTTGESKRMEAIRIDYDKDVYAKAHIESIGWIDYGKIDINTIIGTTGEAKRLECLCLKGNFKYRVHIQGTGWTNWTNADGIATMGTVGQALRMEAIEIVEI